MKSVCKFFKSDIKQMVFFGSDSNRFTALVRN